MAGIILYVIPFFSASVWEVMFGRGFSWQPRLLVVGVVSFVLVSFHLSLLVGSKTEGPSFLTLISSPMLAVIIGWALLWRRRGGEV